MSEIPGTIPSPFDPTPWPPWDRLAAAGAGEYYGSLVRQLDAELAVDQFDATEWAAAKLAAAQDHGVITVKDRARLTALLNPLTDGPSAGELFDEAMDDPESSQMAVALLSIAKYKAEQGSGATDGSTAGTKATATAGMATGAYLAALGPVGLGIFVALEVAEHVEVSVSWT